QRKEAMPRRRHSSKGRCGQHACKDRDGKNAASNASRRQRQRLSVFEHSSDNKTAEMGRIRLTLAARDNAPKKIERKCSGTHDTGGGRSGDVRLRQRRSALVASEDAATAR
ncbi:hypothetical protein Dimus_037317, partial [Dionaea muscipula]